MESEKTIIRKCVNHGETEFFLRSDGFYRCYKCSTDAVIKKRKELKKLAVEYKGGKCQICGYNRCIEALDFHHIDPKEKDFNVSESGETRGWDRIRNEIQKCLLLCSNCHREVHNGVIHVSYEKLIKDVKNNIKEFVVETKPKQFFCEDCGCEISKYGKKCKECNDKSRRKVERPSIEVLKERIKTIGIMGTSREYGVSHTTIGKWLKRKS